MGKLAVVVIGRNEGARLTRCLASVMKHGVPVVYVDSGSQDGSADRARKLGADVLELDAARPFSAARARNAGIQHVQTLDGSPDYVQLVDGDCEIRGNWLDTARCFLEENENAALVAGRLRERERDRSIYTRLADLEWDQPPGVVAHVGGIAALRLGAWSEAGGFDESLIAGEEPELCLRLRRLEWHIHRVADEMAWHEIGMTRLGQWWRRMRRAGFAFAEGAARHGDASERYCVRETLSALGWGLAVPLLALGLAWPTGGWSLLLLCGYAVLVLRIRSHMTSRDISRADATLYALSCAFGKVPQALGACTYWMRRMLGKRQALIEYKTPTPEEPGDAVKAG